MAFIQRVHDFLTSCGVLANVSGKSPSLHGRPYLGYLLYANEDAFCAIGCFSDTLVTKCCEIY